MIRSMTGYGRAVQVFDDMEFSVEIKSVNSRGLDLSIRMPRAYSALEDRLKKLICTRVKRGKVDVYCHIRSSVGTNDTVTLDTNLAKQYIDALYQLRDAFNLKDDITVSTVSRNHELFIHESPEDDLESAWGRLELVACEALDSFIQAREREGAELARDFEEKLAVLEHCHAIISEKAPETVTLYQERLTKKVTELVGSKFDEARILTEVAILADRVAVDEELTRLASHFKLFRNHLQATKSIGLDMNALIQEILRETNTIGSKCSRLDITNIVLQLKSEIEKIREQIQNVE